VLGELEPCGCRSNPYGGMIRKSHLLKRQEDKDLILVDGGDLLYPTTPMPQILKKQAELQAGYLLKAMEMTGHDVVVPGERDFALGTASFEKLIKASKIKFLAANLKKKSGTFLPASTVIKRGGIRVGILGLVGESIPWPSDLKVTSAIAAAKKEVPELKSKSDVLIVVTHQGLDEDVKLAKAVPGIDIIVGAHSQSFLQMPAQIGKTTIYQSSYRNQYVGIVPLHSPFSGKGHELVGLDASLDDPEGKPSKMGEFVAEFKKKITELNDKEEVRLNQVEVKNPEAPENKFHTFVGCAECHRTQFDFWRKTSHAKALHPLLKDKQFQNKECLGCHSVGLGDPAGFSSVNALAVLHPTEEGKKGVPLGAEELAPFLKEMAEASSMDSKVTLKRDESESQPLSMQLARIEKSWAPVQCENCHNPAKSHPFSGSYTKVVEKNACFKCHSKERAPEWYTTAGQPDWDKIAQKRKLITCPATPSPSSDDKSG
jgi:predicted CXXCH cytochrome family protein